jgi:ribosomal protein S18 acetylase RimI-like enzyme
MSAVARQRSGVTVRPAAPADYPAIARLTVAAYEADGQIQGEAVGYADTLADVAGRAGAGDLLVADDGAAVVGAVLFVRPGSRYAGLSRPGEAEFRMLAVDPAAQGRGIGRTLVGECVARARAAGCSAIAIGVRDFSMPAQKLYGSLGFARTPALDWSPMPDVRLLALRLDLEGGPAGDRGL